MENKQYGVGILGCGMIAHYHAKALQEIPQAFLLGAYDARPESGTSFCESYRINQYPSSQALLADPQVDAVCVCLPSGLHYSAAMACIGAGKHVIIEKPMTFTAGQAEEVIRKAEEFGVRITVISQLRYTPAVAALKEAVTQGWFGKLAAADIYMKYYRDPAYYRESPWKGTQKLDGGGALMNQGIHGVDLLQYLAGPVISVQARTATLCHNIEVEDTVAAVLEFESGTLGVLQATTSVYPGFSRRLELCGTEGTAILTEDAITYSAFRDSSHSLPCSRPRYQTGSRPDGMDYSLHKRQIADFLAAVAKGENPFIDGNEGKKAVAIIEAVYRSARSGERIFIN